MAMLWPELDERSARNNLKQTVFSIRHALGVAVFDRAESNLRVDPELIVADVQRFEHALATGAYEEAVSLYDSPFLDGFHLAHAPDFDRWAERTRTRLAWHYVRALETLATAARLRGDSAAVRWCHALVEHDPVSTTYALALITALNDAGEQLAALEHVRAYTRLLREEFDTEPDQRIVAAGERLLQRTPSLARAAAQSPVREREVSSPTFALLNASREAARRVL
jgi:DNA-binding SARP family transcriptional activator